MTWNELKEFCSTLTKEQLESTVTLFKGVQDPMEIEAEIVNENCYVTHDGESCIAESLIKESLDNLKKKYSKGDVVFIELY